MPAHSYWRLDWGDDCYNLCEALDKSAGLAGRTIPGDDTGDALFAGEDRLMRSTALTLCARGASALGWPRQKSTGHTRRDRASENMLEAENAES